MSMCICVICEDSFDSDFEGELVKNTKGRIREYCERCSNKMEEVRYEYDLMRRDYRGLKE